MKDVPCLGIPTRVNTWVLPSCCAEGLPRGSWWRNLLGQEGTYAGRRTGPMVQLYANVFKGHRDQGQWLEVSAPRPFTLVQLAFMAFGTILSDLGIDAQPIKLLGNTSQGFFQA